MSLEQLNSAATEHLFYDIFNYSFNVIDVFIFNFSQIEILGLSLYTNGSLWLFICSFILLLAMISAIFLSTGFRQVKNN